jgi:hypothetical protein
MEKNILAQQQHKRSNVHTTKNSSRLSDRHSFSPFLSWTAYFVGFHVCIFAKRHSPSASINFLPHRPPHLPHTKCVLNLILSSYNYVRTYVCKYLQGWICVYTCMCICACVFRYRI